MSWHNDYVVPWEKLVPVCCTSEVDVEAVGALIEAYKEGLPADAGEDEDEEARILCVVNDVYDNDDVEATRGPIIPFISPFAGASLPEILRCLRWKVMIGARFLDPVVFIVVDNAADGSVLLCQVQETPHRTIIHEVRVEPAAASWAAALLQRGFRYVLEYRQAVGNGVLGLNRVYNAWLWTGTRTVFHDDDDNDNDNDNNNEHELPPRSCSRTVRPER